MDLPEREEDSLRPARFRVGSAPLSWKAARTLYNLADALWPPDGRGPEGGALDVARPVGRGLRHDGPGAARRVWLWLTWLDWAPLLHSRRRFWRLSREERAATFARFEESRFALARRAAAELRARLARAVDELHSSDGA